MNKFKRLVATRSEAASVPHKDRLSLRKSAKLFRTSEEGLQRKWIATGVLKTGRRWFVMTFTTKEWMRAALDTVARMSSRK